MVAQQMILTNMKEDQDSSLVEGCEIGRPIKSFDPDNDGYEFGLEDATLLHKNMNIL